MPETKASKGRARIVAFYLPQFYPTPENDEWWGPGFTDWTNVAQANPRFRGHYQPHQPADLGYYDLRLPESRIDQANLARHHGVEAFCYWHYWFEGLRLLGRPFDEVLASGEPDFPFCLAWANESWARTWHGTGTEGEYLVRQTYSAEDDVRHARWLTKAFSDPRYLRVDGRPLLVIHRPWDLPDAGRTLDVIRVEATAVGLKEPYIVGSDSHATDRDARDLGFDRTLLFEPALGTIPGITVPGIKTRDYEAFVRTRAAVAHPFPTWPTVFPSWDNTARRGDDAVVLINSSPEAFRNSLQDALESVKGEPPEERIIFVNAWNEWAEGNHLEPDLQYGMGWLESIRDGIGS